MTGIVPEGKDRKGGGRGEGGGEAEETKSAVTKERVPSEKEPIREHQTYSSDLSSFSILIPSHLQSLHHPG